ncbi:hypothetical protein Hte_009017 [Hypoxylon texense]
MSDLRQPNHSNLKQYASNPNLGNNWLNASTSDLVPPVPMRNPSRPSTPVKQQPPTWISPLEMHSTNGPPLVAAPPKSSMGQYGLKLKIPPEPAPFPQYGDDDVSPKAPMPLRIRRPSPSPRPEPLLKGSQSPKKPPSPPQSVRASEDSDHSPVLNRPIFPRDDIRPSSRGSHRNMSTTLKEVQNTWDMPDYGPATLPSPISTPRGSEDQAPANAAANLWDDDLDLFTAPIIQTVRARRDTLTSITSRRRSMEIKIEELEKPAVADALQRPKMSGGPQQQQPRRPMRPPPLNLERRARTPDRAGTYPPPAPYYTIDQPPSTPTDDRTRRPPRDRAGPPPAAVGARGRPGRGVHRPNVDEYDLQPQPPASRRASQDSSVYDERPLSPDSPLMPVTGPLASPRFAALESQLAPPPRGGARFRMNRDPSPLRESESPISDLELAAPRLGRRNVPTPDSSQWPLPSPTASSFDAASVSCSQRAESPFVVGTRGAREPPLHEPESPTSLLGPLPTPPRVIPVPPRADSPFGFRSFNFSRPMTPSNDLPLRHDPHPPRRADTVPVSPMYRDPDVSPSPGRPPPPRAATVNHGSVGRGLRSPAIVGDDFGGGFI